MYVNVCGCSMWMYVDPPWIRMYVDPWMRMYVGIGDVDMEERMGANGCCVWW